MKSPATAISRAWTRLSPLPGGRRAFDMLLGRMIPYTGTIRPRVLELRQGYARIQMRDRRRVRNHLDSVHAIAVMNLAEITSGLALHFGLPAHARGILTGLSIEYVKKARGLLTAECNAPTPNPDVSAQYRSEATVRNEAGEVVARAIATWLVGPR